jgi:basic membrane protein A
MMTRMIGVETNFAVSNSLNRCLVNALSLTCHCLLLCLLPMAGWAQSSLPPCPKDVKAYWHNCFGTYTSPDGHKYEGEFKNNDYNGQGTQTFPDGHKYVGQFKDGNRNGQGTAIFPDGRKYVGEFKDNKRNGQGTLTFPSGEKYVGQYKDGLRSGQGTLTFPDGHKYVGQFKDGEKHGQGIEYRPDGTVNRSGLWTNGSLTQSYALDKNRFPFYRTQPLKAAWIYVGPVGDAGWSFTHDQGRLAVEARFGEAVKTTFIDKVPEDADAERVIRELAQQGNKIIFATSFGYMEAMLKVAADLPDVKFEHATGYKTAPNMRIYDANFYQSAYMAGVIAGRMTKTNVLGFVGSFPIPEVLRNINAFTLGAQSVNPKIRTKVVWVNTWYDPGKESEAAQSLINQQADVLLQNTDSTAVLETAEKNGKYAFGWDSDMSRFGPKAHLGSAIVNWAPYYIKAIEEVKAGTWSTGRTVWGVKEGLNDLIKISNLVPADARKRIDGVRVGLKDGSFSVFTGPVIANSGRQRLAAGRVVEQSWLDSMDFYVQGVEGRVPGEATANSSDLSSSSVASSPTAVEAEAARKQQELEQRLATETRERERQAAEAEAARRRQQELERQLAAQAEEARRQQQQLQQQLAQEARERERLTAEGRERDRLAAEVDAIRRQQQQLQQQLAAAQNQSSPTPPSPMMATPPNAHALVIGNAAYSGSGRLDNPVNDANAISQKLRAMGFSVTTITDANRQRLVQAMAQFRRSAASADLSLLFYSGHGVQIYGTNYILPIDVDQTDVAQATVQGVRLNEVVENFMPGKTKLVFLDACRDNPLQRTGDRSVSKGLAPISAAQGTLISYATKDGQVALDGVGQKNSPFTQALLEHIADPSDIAVVLRKVREKVMLATGGKQQPWEYGSLTGGELVLSSIKQSRK